MGVVIMVHTLYEQMKRPSVECRSQL